MISIKVKNPSDSRTVEINIETYDDQHRVIGISQQPFTYSAIPKPLQATATKSSNYVSTSFTLNVEITLG